MFLKKYYLDPNYKMICCLDIYNNKSRSMYLCISDSVIMGRVLAKPLRADLLDLDYLDLFTTIILVNCDFYNVQVFWLFFHSKFFIISAIFPH